MNGKEIKKAVDIAARAGSMLLRSGADRGCDLSTSEGRRQYLSGLGWELDPESEECRQVRIPKELDEVLSRYNELQLEQGHDLEKHLGESCEQYSFTVLNYPDTEETVRITLYIQGKELIACDLHSTAFDGFMRSLCSRSEI